MNKTAVAKELLKVAKSLLAASNHALAGKAVAALLKKKFPRTRFSVRSQSYSGGSSVNIHWTDGPTTREVNALVKDFEYGTFDPMTDYYNNDNVRRDIPQVKYVSTSRHMSDKVEKQIEDELAKKFRVDMRDKDAVFEKFNDHYGRQNLIHREFSERSL